ncbi:MAG: XdhC family protein [Bacteroidetes bacterium]|nr:MAG: XdhC family protein [Bacteroidota bacterium]
MNKFYQKIIDAQKSNLRVALCVIVNTKGSTPREKGAKMLVYSNGEIFGSIGGGELEKAVIANAIRSLKTGQSELFRHDLLHQHNMCCGGSVEIFIEPIMEKDKLYIFGAGHTGHALASHARLLDFEVVIIDDRKEYLDQIDLDGINKLHLHYSQALPLLPMDEQTYICIMTYSHPYDRDILSFCIKKPVAYLGMIGSRRKVEMTKKMFVEAGVGTISELENVDMPMGIDIAAETPDEIAISILAKMISVRRVKTT